MADETMQRKTVEVRWDPQLVGEREDQVRVRVEEHHLWRTVRRVDNDGAANITFPDNFKGPRTVRIQGPDGSVEIGVEVH